MDFNRFRQRIVQKIDRFGESVVIGGQSMKVFLQPLDSGRLHVYLDDTEAQAVMRPGLFLIAKGDADIDVNDTLSRSGRIYTVRKVAVEYLANQPVLKFAVLS